MMQNLFVFIFCCIFNKLEKDKKDSLQYFQKKKKRHRCHGDFNK